MIERFAKDKRKMEDLMREINKRLPTVWSMEGNVEKFQYAEEEVRGYLDEIVSLAGKMSGYVAEHMDRQHELREYRMKHPEKYLVAD